MQAVGLVNAGNMCFFNSMIQFLLTCDEFREKVADNKDKDLSSKLHAIVEGMSARRATINASDLLRSVPGTRPGDQGDSAEHLVKLVDILSREMPDVNKCFETERRTLITCSKCGYELRPKTGDSFPRELIYDIDDPEMPLDQQLRHAVTVVPDYRCDKCGQMDSCMKKSLLKSINRAVIFNLLPAFEHEPPPSFEVPLIVEVDGTRQKLLATYRLVASVKHGGTPHSGHYHALALRRDGNGASGSTSFYELNDATVVRLDDQKMLEGSAGAVLLMYQRA